VRYFLDPFGCAKNQVDAETMMAVLNGSGWEPVPDPGSADLIIINSCGFIESAKRESINAVLSYRQLYPNQKLLLAGCLAQRYASELDLPEADLFFGNRDLSRIHEAASLAMSGAGQALPLADVPQVPLVPKNRPLLSLPGSAYIKISEGCNNGCAFCAIPLIRGPLVSRSIEGLVAECQELLDRGIRELCLIGQDTGSFGQDRGESLPGLLSALSALEGDFWVRLLYIHPDNFPFEILEIMRDDPRLLPYFDLPFQHGSTEVLRAMGRRGTAETYLGLLERIRMALPDAVIRSTFLLGFPGETDENFQALLDFQARATLDWVGCFTYSREEGTPAYSMRPRVPKHLAVARQNLIEERQTPITEGRMERFVGRSMDVLVEEALDEGLYLGRVFCQAPDVDGSTLIHCEVPLDAGVFTRAVITALNAFDLVSVCQ
jgi:ribosomal protein S12 methylthiotransferase